MIPEYFVIVGAVINLLGALSYILDALRGKIKPNKVTWGLWALAPLIAFAAEIKQGVGIQSLMTFMVGFSPLLIFIASFFNRKSYWEITRFDIFCAVLSVIGLVLWWVTKVGNVAILFSLFADFMAGVPTLIKSFRFPETENYLEFLSSFISAGLTMLTLTVWNFEYLAFPLYIFLFDLVGILFIKFKLGKIIAARVST